MYYKVNLIFQIQLGKLHKPVSVSFKYMRKEEEGGSKGLNVLFVKNEDSIECFLKTVRSLETFWNDHQNSSKDGCEHENET